MRYRGWFLIVLVLPALLAACGGGDDDSGGGPPGGATAEPAGFQSVDDGQSATRETGSVAERVLESHVDPGLTSGRRMGAEEAPLVLEVFEDFLCSHCLSFTANTEPMLIEEYVNTGKLAIEFRHFPVLGRGSVASAIAAECATAQDAFWPYNRLLFANQANGVAPSANGFVGLAATLELNLVEFEHCLNDTVPLATVQADFDLAQTIGFTGTPSFRLNGEALPGQPSSLDAWRALLDGELAGD